MLPGIVGVEEIGAWLGIGERGARALLARGELPSFKLGKRLYCRLADLEAAIAGKVAETARRKDRAAVAARLAAGLPPYRPVSPRRRAPTIAT